MKRKFLVAWLILTIVSFLISCILGIYSYMCLYGYSYFASIYGTSFIILIHSIDFGVRLATAILVFLMFFFISPLVFKYKEEDYLSIKENKIKEKKAKRKALLESKIERYEDELNNLKNS